MPANRHRLHLTKIDDFATWAEGQGYVRERLKGAYEVLRLRAPNGAYLVFFGRNGCDHATVPYGHGDGLVSRWLRERGGDGHQQAGASDSQGCPDRVRHVHAGPGQAPVPNHVEGIARGAAPMTEAMRPLWHKEPCWECGTEGFATRTVATPKSQPYICDECATYRKAYDEGRASREGDYRQGQRDMLAKVLRALRRERDRLRGVAWAASRDGSRSGWFAADREACRLDEITRDLQELRP